MHCYFQPFQLLQFSKSCSLICLNSVRDFRNPELAEGPESLWDSSNILPWEWFSREAFAGIGEEDWALTMQPSQPHLLSKLQNYIWSGLSCGEAASYSKRKFMTSGIRVCESHIQASLPLTNQHPEVTNSLRCWHLFRGTFRLPLSCASSAIRAALDGHRGHDCCLGFPSLLHPEVKARTLMFSLQIGTAGWSQSNAVWILPRKRKTLS